MRQTSGTIPCPDCPDGVIHIRVASARASRFEPGFTEVEEVEEGCEFCGAEPQEHEIELDDFLAEEREYD